MCYLHLLYYILIQYYFTIHNIYYVIIKWVKREQKGKINIQCTSLCKNENFYNLGIKKTIDVDSFKTLDSQSVFISIFLELTLFRNIYRSNQHDQFTILHKNLLHLPRCVFGDLNNSKFSFTFYCDFSGM